jgi:arylsulfatase A
MIARWPAGITKPGDRGHVSAFWDFLPTACEIAGADASAGLHGISFLPVLTGNGGQRAHDFRYWECHEPGTRRALLRGGWKLVHHAVSKNGEPELYQIGKELAETSGLAAPHPDRVAAMPGIIEERRMPSPVFPDKSLDRQQLTASP